jgi:hypothetical protein
MVSTGSSGRLTGAEHGSEMIRADLIYQAACASEVVGKFVSGFVWPILLFVAMITAGFVLAFFVSRKLGRTAQDRQMLFSLVALAGIVVSAGVFFLRLAWR